MANIQLIDSENCCLIPDDTALNASTSTVFFGMRAVSNTVKQWFGKAQSNSNGGLVLVVGPPKSGRTTIANYVLPNVLSTITGQDQEVIHYQVQTA